MPNLYLPGASVLLSLFLVILFFSKQRKKNFDTKIFQFMITIQLLESVVETIIYIICYKYSNSIAIIKFLNNFVCTFYVLWVWLFYRYLFYVAYINKYDKKFDMLRRFEFVLNGVIIFMIFLSPINIMNENGVMYSYGMKPTITYIACALWFAFAICVTLTNKKNWKSKKYIPLWTLFGIAFLVFVVRSFDPSIIIIPFALTFINLVMYFTIENPDVKINNEMKRNNEIVEQAYIDKSNFLFEMTSEVKEPLNVVRDMCKELEEENDVRNLKEGVKAINHSIRQLDFIVNNVLNVSSLDIQRIKIMKNKYSVQMLCEDLIMRVRPNISEKVEFRQKMPNSIPALYGDNIKLKQILYSLLMESARKTSKGFIEFSVNTIEKYDVCRVIFTISDSSAGMGIDKINEILSITGKLDAEDIKNLEKMEFNIELCQKLIKSLGGNLLIKSSKEKGTETIITIDQQVCREEVIEEKSQEEKRVMVVSQDKKISAKIKKIMSDRNISASYVLYGMDAVDRIKSGKRYDYIIIEDDMKEVSGYVTLKELQKLEGFDIPCIVMLKENKEMIKKHYLEEGFKDYILISNFKEELIRIIDKY